MRLAYLCSDFGIPVFGTKGAAVHVREFVQPLADLGIDVHILAARLGGNAPKDWKIPIHEFPLEGWPAIIQDVLAQETTVPGWERMAKDWRSLAYAQYLAQAGLPFLQKLQPDLIYERYSLFAWAGASLAAELGVPHVLEINSPLADEQSRYRQLSLNATAHRLEAELLRRADLVVCVSSAIQDYVAGLEVPPGRLIVLPNGVDPECFNPVQDGKAVRQRLGIEQAFVIGFAGSLKPWHGVESLLEASASLPGVLPWRLLIVGNGPLKATLEMLAADLDISDRVIFTGPVPHEQIPPYLAAMDIAVAPYPALEDFYFSPLKLFEYMAMALPVVAPALGQIVQVITNMENGWLYPPGDIRALTDSLARLAKDPDLRAMLGKSARAYVVANHSWKQNGEKLLGWFQKLQPVRVASRAAFDPLINPQELPTGEKLGNRL